MWLIYSERGRIEIIFMKHPSYRSGLKLAPWTEPENKEVGSEIDLKKIK